MMTAEYVVMTVGDLGSGRTSLNLAFSYDKFYGDETPSHLHQPLSKGVFMKEQTLYTCVVYEDFVKYEDEACERRRLSDYPQVNAFIALFDVASKESLDSLESRWIPEVREHCPDTPIVIVANKIDLRDSGKCETISMAEGMDMATKMGTSYFEVSCLQLKGVEDCFIHAMELAMYNTKDMREKLHLSTVLYPPLKPLPPVSEPEIEISASKFSEDWRKMLSDSKYQDVVFNVEGETYSAHKMVMSAASPFFKQIFISDAPDSFSHDDLNYGKVEGIKKMSEVEGVMTLELCDVKVYIFDMVLEFIYTGCLSVNCKDESISDLMQTAKLLEVTELVTHCDNLSREDGGSREAGLVKIYDFSKGSTMKPFLKQDVFSDVAFKIEDSEAIPCHKVVVYARNDKMAALFEATSDDDNDEGESPKEIPISDTSVESLSLFLEYLYTDSVDLEGTSDLIGLLVLADKYGAHRLVTLCEDQLKKAAGKKDGEKYVSVESLQKYKTSKAKQMVDWCRYYISRNYGKYSDKDLSSLDKGDKEWINKNRFPPLSYVKDMEDFEKTLAGNNNTCVVM